MGNPNLSKPLYSIIVLIYNRTPELLQMARDCVTTVKNYSKDYELIIVDNGSTEHYDWSKECDTYIRFDKNYGISRGWNIGLLASRGVYKVILGDDTLVSEGWLEGLKEAMQMPNAGVVNPHVEHLPAGEGIVENYKWPSGACFMLTQNTLDKVGYFDQDTYWPANWEDLDYWYRLYKAGFKMYRNYHVSIQHLEGQTVHSPDISAHSDDNKRAFIKKHGFDPTNVFFAHESIESHLQT